MNKSDLAKALAKMFDLPLRKSEDIVDTLFNTRSRTLAEGERIEIRGFGSFVLKQYGAYTGRNPKTGEKTEVMTKKLPFFKAGKDFREGLNRE